MTLPPAFAAALFLMSALHLHSQTSSAAQPSTKSVGCKADKQPLTAAEIASYREDFKEAASLFTTELADRPHDDRLRAGQVRSKLASGDVAAAAHLADAWVAEKPESGAALTTKAETTLRMGELPGSYSEAAHAQKLDPCNGRVYYVLSEYEDMIALHATQKRHLDLAHALAPTDPEITVKWIAFQTRAQASKEWADFVDASPVFTDANRTAARKRAAQNKDRAEQNDCHLVSALRETTIPFSAIRYSPDSPPAYGLEMSFNGKKRRLELDTGASGLTLTAGAAQGLGLATEDSALVGGIGDAGVLRSRVTHVAQLKIGGLEFANCNVYILPPRDMEGAQSGYKPFMDDIDGLVGGDLFRSFLLTLDYPGGEMRIGPLPARPGDEQTSVTLNTNTERNRHDLGTDLPPQDRYRSPEMKDWPTFYRIYHFLLIPTQLDNGPVKLLMADTGADQNIISPDAARSVTHVSTSNRVSMHGLSGSTKNNYLTDKIVLHFAQLYLPLPWMIAIETTRFSQDAGVEISGFLGFPALRQLTLQIDYRDSLIHFTYDPKRPTNTRFAASSYIR